MLVSLFDKASGFFSRRCIMGRRVALDLSAAVEPRVAVVSLPLEGTFYFSVKKRLDSGLSSLVLSTKDGEELLAEFSDPAEAAHALKKIKVGMLRPFKRVVLGALGVIAIVVAFDLAALPRSERLPSSSPQGSSRMAPPAISGLGGQGLGTLPPAQSPAPAQSSPEADAAIRMLGGGR